MELQKFYEFGYEPGLSGFLTLIPFLSEQLGDPYEEHYPTFARRISDGGWFTVEKSELIAERARKYYEEDRHHLF
jgi:hypothetical protein